ncbi:phage portal protein [Sphingopyxis sp. PET50]|uniref:phage portal protein n=1 Tax=Sphingopyxis sp. PET50 TaxID=2976533 RepID=UPI0021AF6B7F|nr:phage portal protein [Sphingopyxis sp. PET50]
MKILGFDITRTKAALSPPDNRGWYRILESFGGAWQRNVEVNHESVLANSAVFACMTLIASDIAKLRVKLVQQTKDGIWEETSRPAYSPVLRKPNHFQTRIQFFESWVLSKLSRGNTYVLKKRDNRRVVVGLYVLDPNRTKPMIAPNGDIYYQLSTDNIAGIEESQVMVPASEIIHDRFNCMFHPLVGLSPIFASGLAATQGLKIQENSTNFFANASKPGGLLIAPGRIDPDNAARLKETWETNYTGKNAGRIAVLGDGMSFTPLTVDPIDSQMIEQLKWTAEVICSTFHVPSFLVGVGQEPAAGGVQDRTLRYYTQALQVHIEAIEILLDEGLGTGEKLGTEFDLDTLLRMDGASQMEMLKNSAGILSPNEQRAKLDKPKVEGGESPMVQQQNYSLSALAKRDAKDDPFAKDAAPAAPTPANENEPTDAERAAARAGQRALLREKTMERLNA